MLLPFYQDKLLEAGCDEAGRGCLAGPVCAAVVVLPKKYKNKLLDDSKKLTETKRNLLRKQIEEDAIEWAVAMVSQTKIDEINILNSSILAMHMALKQLKSLPEMILVDGNRFKLFQNIPHQTIVKGDGKFLSIAAASILAKTHRDEFMLKEHENFPHYNWARNKGYPTLEHRAAIYKHGQCLWHRKSFKLLADQIPLL